MVLPWCAVADSGGCLLGKADEPHTITQQQQHTLEKSTTQYTVHWVWNCTLHFTVSSSRHYHTLEKSTTPHHTGPHYTVYFTFYSILYIHTTLCMKLHISKHHTAADTTHTGQHYTANCTLYHADRHCNCTLCASVESSALALIALR